MSTRKEATQPNEMNPNKSTEHTSTDLPSVNDALRALQKALEDTLKAKEAEDDLYSQMCYDESKSWARADAELLKWKSFARDTWQAACGMRCSVNGRLKEVQCTYSDLLEELQRFVEADDDFLF